MNILVVAHDAGGAEVVSSWVRRNFSNRYCFILQGPSVSIFERKIGCLVNRSESELEKLIVENDLVLTGTGWGADLEKNAIRFAKKLGVRVSSYLDHWCMYRERFILDGNCFFPDEIWVGDDDALMLANESLPQQLIKYVPNPYFMDVQDELDSASENDMVRDCSPYTILFVCESIEDSAVKGFGDAMYYNYTEIDALKFFLDNLSRSDLYEKNLSIVLRPHPADADGKYDFIVERYGEYNISITNNSLLVYDCLQSNVVVGCESMAMVIGLLANKKVVSCIPPYGKRSSIMPSAIIDYSNIVY